MALVALVSAVLRLVKQRNAVFKTSLLYSDHEDVAQAESRVFRVQGTKVSSSTFVLKQQSREGRCTEQVSFSCCGQIL